MSRATPCYFFFRDDANATHGCRLDAAHVARGDDHRCGHEGCEWRMAVTLGEKVSYFVNAVQQLGMEMHSPKVERLAGLVVEIDEMWPFVRAALRGHIEAKKEQP